MKLHNFLIGTLIATLLLVSTASAQGPMGPGHGMPDMSQDGHMMDGTSHMEIDGTIVVEDAIILTLTIQPNEEMRDRMEHRRGSMSPEEYTNQIIVQFTSLVEFEDQTGDGFTADDTVVSTFVLENLSLSQPILVDDTNYKISSLDGTTFIMTVDLSFEDNIFYGFKWSLDIQYPFESTTSSLAMIHEVDTNRGHMTQRHRMQHQIPEGADYMLNETQVRDADDRLPMFFSWVSDVTVDGQTENIIASVISESIAISVPQGEVIYYDPAMGVDPQALEIADNKLAELQGFLGSIMSPTYMGLFLGFVALVAVGGYAIAKKRSLA